MIAEYKEKITFRLSTKEKSEIEKLIRKEKFKTISDVIRLALKKFFSSIMESEENASE